MSSHHAFELLRDRYLRYYDTPFGLADPNLQRERRALLDRDGGAYRIPWVEAIPTYRPAPDTLEEACARLGLGREVVDLARCGLFPVEISHPYLHQAQALEAATEGKHVVVTAGTGSGKTEAVLLPVLQALVRESATWGGAPAAPTPWWNGNGPWVPQRSGEAGHRPAVRAMVLYPMNALVEDQLVRLRRAFDSPPARAWLQRHRNGHRFYFGRYTGPTPVSGSPGNETRLSELRSYLRSAEQLSTRAREVGEEEGNPDTQFHVPAVDGGEMWSRWDMQHAAPDILITNYSMLNAGLLRGLEAPMWDHTREWLEADPSHTFRLVVDELHMYRGTAGTEVAYLVRKLLNRLGLDRPERRDQVQFLAASASLEGDGGHAYLEQFFAAPASTFAVIGGTQDLPAPTRNDLTDAVEDLIALDADDLGAVRRHRDANGTSGVLMHTLTVDAEGNELPAPRARSLDHIGRHAFPGEPDPTRREAAAAKLLDLAMAKLDRPDDLRLRLHLFFRNIQGMWACSDPACPEVPTEHQMGRGIGKLHAEPRYRCDCGARVLELLYCETCGDIALGGFGSPSTRVVSGSVRAGQRIALLPEQPKLARVPDAAPATRTAANYLMYWPRRQELVCDKPAWTATPGRFEFHRVVYNPRRGELGQTMDADWTGWGFFIGTTVEDDAQAAELLDQIPAIPVACPSCGDDWEAFKGGPRKLPITDKRRMRSPVQTMRTGYARVAQVLGNAVLDGLGGERRLVAFSDSRSDAATLAAGLEAAHHRELVRQLLLTTIHDMLGQANQSARLAEATLRYFRDDDASCKDDRRLFRAQHPEDHAAIEDAVEDGDLELAAGVVARHQSATAEVALEPLLASIEGRLLHLGHNPGGPAKSLQAYEVGEKRARTARPWGDLLRKAGTARAFKAPGQLGPEQEELLSSIRTQLRQDMALSLFGKRSYDMESLGLGWSAIAGTKRATGSLPADVVEQVVAGSLRVLGTLRRFDIVFDAYNAANAPRALRRYWEGVAKAQGLPLDAIQSAVETAWAGRVLEYKVVWEHIRVRPATGQMWCCGSCGRVHLHPAGGACTGCGSALLDPEPAREPAANYYTELAVNTAPTRLHVRELTGQTDRDDAIKRQARFQDIFLREEDPMLDGVDVLSVTTTMEAGVDIGALRGVLMANMPPQRFNYQQRVGRAGRRGDPLAIALTFCRDRSHDETYFEDPDAITGDSPPQPYIDVSRPEILQRVIRHEALRRAFAQVAAGDPDFDPGHAVTGHFGPVDAWDGVRDTVHQWGADNVDPVVAFARSLARHTKLAAVAEDLARRVCANLATDVDRAFEGGRQTADLSQLLAEEGLLPMLGFPTKVRNLFHKWPSRWPPSGTIDRPMDMAINQFAPGNQVPKDHGVHTPIGVANWIPRGSRAVPDPDPLGPRLVLEACRACQFVQRPDGEDDATDACPACGEVKGFARIPLAEPNGFRTDFKEKDYVGSLQRGAYAGQPRIIPVDTTNRARHGALEATSGPARLYTINDNEGSLYTFMPAANWVGLVCTDLYQGLSDGSVLPRKDSLDPDAAQRVALGSVKYTDAILVGGDSPTPSAITALSPAGHGVGGGAIARRAAWYSLAFLLTRAAAKYLDVDVQELNTGLQVREVDGELTARAFLADSLENGAGFSTHLGQQANFEAWIEVTNDLLHRFREPAHTTLCDSACYRCLKDYANQRHHPILDWRLAGQLLGLLTGTAFDPQPAYEAARAQVSQFATDTGGQAIEDLPLPAVELEGVAGLILHPFEPDPKAPGAGASTMARRALSDLHDRYGTDATAVYTTFDLHRRPSWLMQHMINHGW